MNQRSTTPEQERNSKHGASFAKSAQSTSCLADPNSNSRSKWLLKNCVFVHLAAGSTFYDSARLPKRKVRNRFSLFAETVKKCRQAETS